MKIRNLLPGFALAALLALGITGTAHANDYTGNCANFPNLTGGGTFDGHGDVDISDTGTCSLPQAVTATGHVHITASGSISTSTTIQGAGEVTLSGTSVNVKDVVSTGNRLKIIATSGDIDTQAVTANGEYIQVLAPSGKITINGAVTGHNLTEIFKASDDVGLKGGATNNGGDVRVFAHTSGSSNTAFEIGSSSSNGVTFINTNGVGSGTIYISNGVSTGGINYSGSDKLQVRASGTHAGTIVLDGGSTNKITLADDMNANGSAGQSSGGILLFAPEVISNGATLSANSPGHHVGNISLTTNKVTINSAGLNLEINGDGSFPDFVNLSITPVGSWSVTGSDDPAAFVTFGPFTSSPNTLSITGTGLFYISADGYGNGLKIWGNSLTINPGATLISQVGGWNAIALSAWDGASTLSALTLAGSIEIHENTGAPGEGRNLIEVDAVSINTLTSRVLLDASGTSGGDGSNITIAPTQGAISFGDSGSNFSLNANGSSTGGDAGTIYAGSGSDSLTLVINDGEAITASGLANNGNGGFIYVAGAFVSSTGNIRADANGSGTGGNVTIDQTDLGDVMTLSGAVISASAASDGSGNGGNITINGMYSADLSTTLIKALGSSNGNGGLGGTVIVNLAGGSGTDPLNVNASIFVSGDTASLSTTDFDGSISLNGTTCQQWVTKKAWPATYWDCVNPTSPTLTPNAADVVAAASALQSTLTTNPGRLKDANHQIYIFANPAAMNSFFGTGLSPDEAVGQTFPPAHVGAVFVQDGFGNTNMYMSQTILHELGHALDYIWGNPYSLISGGDWENAYNDDVISPALPGSGTINDVSCFTLWPSPLTVCADHSGTNPATSQPWTNWEIFKDIYPQWDQREMLAILMAYRQSVLHGGSYHGDPTFENTLQYFPNMIFHIDHAISTGTP
ncbi:MAG: hypothetical protein EKK48_12380 [Candidatus Melainabacteria bacterium]|nr:MAG: hypothetical protein EKK48_12380 [Candidatus Melainabacteria bacterium]